MRLRFLLMLLLLLFVVLLLLMLLIVMRLLVVLLLGMSARSLRVVVCAEISYNNLSKLIFSKAFCSKSVNKGSFLFKEIILLFKITISNIEQFRQ
jgi:hypothetical protein